MKKLSISILSVILLSVLSITAFADESQVAQSAIIQYESEKVVVTKKNAIIYNNASGGVFMPLVENYPLKAIGEVGDYLILDLGAEKPFLIKKDVVNEYQIDQRKNEQSQNQRTASKTSDSNSALTDFPYNADGNYIYGNCETGFKIFYSKKNWSDEDYKLGRTRDERYANIGGGDAIIQALNMMESYLSNKFQETEGSSYSTNHMLTERKFVGKFKNYSEVYCYSIWWE